jgi:HSP20 family protein
LIATFELPGIKKDDVKISLHKDILQIEGSKKQEKNTKGEYYHRTERGYGNFKRSIRIPFAVDAKKIKADFKDGVVKIELPKPPEAKVKEIPISND